MCHASSLRQLRRLKLQRASTQRNNLVKVLGSLAHLQCICGATCFVVDGTSLLPLHDPAEESRTLLQA